MIVLISISAMRVSSRRCLTVCSMVETSAGPGGIQGHVLGRGKQAAQLPQCADSLVRALGEIHLFLPGEKPVDEPVDLLAANLAKPRQVFIARRSGLYPRKLERVAALLVRAQAIPQPLQERRKEGFRLLLILEFGKIVIPETLDLLHGRGVHVGSRDVTHEARTNLVIRERAGIALEQGTHRPVVDRLFLAPHRYLFHPTVPLTDLS